MAAPVNATPLIAIDALVIDSETTGLHPKKAWVVEIGAVPIASGRLDMRAPFFRRVNPGVPIPLAATRIHGITDSAVAGIPKFAAIAGEVSRLFADTLVIGHSLGFDLAVLKREFARAGEPWSPPRMLDTRLLAEVVAPDLAGHSIENLAGWLGVAVLDRHSALGDAETTAQIFVAMLPKLREAGIRTIAEAERACRARVDVLDRQYRAGWVEPVQAPPSEPAVVDRVDTFPYRRRIGDIMHVPARFILADEPIAAVLDRMTGEHISSLFVNFGGIGETPRPARSGIITERDVMRALAKDGAAALAMPVSGVASRPLVTVPADGFAYLAVARMSRLGIRHLGVIDAAGTVVGALSARDLLRARAHGALVLGDEIEQAGDVQALAGAWAALPRVASGLIAEEMSGRQVAAVLSRQLCTMTQRATVLAEQRMYAAGQGDPPCAYAFAVLGSAGRGESLLALDQDNALIFADGEPDGRQDRWFAVFGGHVADILHETGVPYCKGGVMAKNPQWRGSLATWRARIADWIDRPNPEGLLSVDIFFDMLGVGGDVSLSDTIWREAFDAARGKPAFAKLLVESVGAVEPALNFLGRIRTEQGRIDVKKSGLFGIVTAARSLAICHHVLERPTPARLGGVKALGLGGERDLDALADAQGTFLDLLLAQQLADIEKGVPPSNTVEVKGLSGRDKDRLREALAAVRSIDELTRDLLFKA